MGNSFVKYLRNKAGASLKGFSVKSLLYWASCFKSVTHPLFLSSGPFIPMECCAH